MNVKVFKNSFADALRGGLPIILFILAFAMLIFFALRHIEVSSRAEGRILLQESINTSVIRHYAIEGSYPESIKVIEDNYGIRIDRSRYAVFYRIIAPNIMPDITVEELK
ncbi:MAG: hypothetical protein FWH17_08890 [Oscillospiraceae bacterium]|nr:hypothetical protein [Oscillospiraceae bacterium]